MTEELAGMVLDDAKDKMANTLEHVKAEFGNVRT